MGDAKKWEMEEKGEKKEGACVKGKKDKVFPLQARCGPEGG